MADVYLHVGLYKTGTTTIQGALGATAQRLAADGVLYPGDQRAQRLAAYDLLGQRVGGEDRGEAAGALGRLLDAVAAHPGPTVVVSEEELSLARPRHARRLVRELAGHRVFVVVGARDMARTLVSAWQQTIVNGGTTSWGDFIASVRGEDGAPPSEGISFHWRHDLLRVVDTWASAVPRENIRLVTVPPRGSSGTALLARFAEAAGLPAPWPGMEQAVRNVSLGAAELEVVRRLNESVADIELLAATQAALVSLALDHGRLFRRYRREFTEREGRLPGVAEVLASQARAGGFWFRKWALHRADRSRLVAMAAHAYADRTSGSRIGP